MKLILLIACVMTLLTASGCVVYERRGHGEIIAPVVPVPVPAPVPVPVPVPR